MTWLPTMASQNNLPTCGPPLSAPAVGGAPESWATALTGVAPALASPPAAVGLAASDVAVGAEAPAAASRFDSAPAAPPSGETGSLLPEHAASQATENIAGTIADRIEDLRGSTVSRRARSGRFSSARVSVLPRRTVSVARGPSRERARAAPHSAEAAR
jgi:hypothetical protein